MKATQIFVVERIIESESGVLYRLHMDLFDLGKGRANGLFLNRFRLSWIFFEVENPDRRVLVDCHSPFGTHLHFDSGPRQAVAAETLAEVRDIFAAAIKNHFGLDVEL